MKNFAIKTASDLPVFESKRGNLVRYSGTPAEIAAQIPEESVCEFFNMLTEENLSQIKEKNSPCMLFSLQNKTWSYPIRSMKEELGFSWRVFNAYIIAARKLIYPDVNYDKPAPLKL